MDAPDAPGPSLYIARYEAWRAERDPRFEADAAAARQMPRELRWMIAFLVGWSLMAAAGGGTLLLWTAR